MQSPASNWWKIPTDGRPPFCDGHDEQLIPDLHGHLYCHWCLVAKQEERDNEARTLEHARETAARKQAELDQRVTSAGIQPRYRDHTFGTFPARTPEARAALSVLRSYANTFRRINRPAGISIVMLGGVGTGKSGLAACVTNAVIADGLTALYMTAYAAVRHQRDTWGRKGPTETEALADLLEPDLLVLDEVGSAVGDPREMAMLFQVLDGRYGQKKPTIVVSNLDMKALRLFLGSRLVDRLQDDSSFSLTFDWPSLRGAIEKVGQYEETGRFE